MFEEVEVVAAEQEGESAGDRECGVDEAPKDGDAAERAGDEGEQKDAGAGDKTEVDDPLVADRIAIGAEEEDGEEEIGEREGVGAVGEERCSHGGCGKGEVNAEDPLKERAAGAEVGGAGEEVKQGLGLPHKRKAREAGHEEAQDQKSETEADAREEAGALGRADLRKRGHTGGMLEVGWVVRERS